MRSKRKSVVVPLGISIRTVNENGYFHIGGRIVTLIDGKVRNGSTLYDPINGGLEAIDNLEIWCQGENDAKDGRRLYGFSIRYKDVYAVERDDAGKMYRTLTLIEKRLAKIQETRSYPKSFGEYVGRVAEAIGPGKGVNAQTMILETPKDQTGSWHHEIEYRYRTIGEGVQWIDWSLVRPWANPEVAKEEAAS